MRQIPIIAAILVAAVLAPVAASADRMWIGFHDDPVLRYDAEKATDMEVATKTNKATILRTPRDVGQHRAGRSRRTRPTPTTPPTTSTTSTTSCATRRRRTPRS